MGCSGACPRRTGGYRPSALVLASGWAGRRAPAVIRQGCGPPAAELTADAFELFRTLSGRRSLDQVRALAWDGDPEPNLDLLTPYPMPRPPLTE